MRSPQGRWPTFCSASYPHPCARGCCPCPASGSDFPPTGEVPCAQVVTLDPGLKPTLVFSKPDWAMHVLRSVSLWFLIALPCGEKNPCPRHHAAVRCGRCSGPPFPLQWACPHAASCRACGAYLHCNFLSLFGVASCCFPFILCLSWFPFPTLPSALLSLGAPFPRKVSSQPLGGVLLCNWGSVATQMPPGSAASDPWLPGPCCSDLCIKQHDAGVIARASHMRPAGWRLETNS